MFCVTSIFVLHIYPEGKTRQRNLVWDLRSSSTQILSSPRGTELTLTRTKATFIRILRLIIRRNLMRPRKKQKAKIEKK
jgi:hypothetical protein